MNALLILAMAGGDAHAWEHIGKVWDRDDFPIEWYITDYVEDSLEDPYHHEVIETAYSNWEVDAPCARLSFDNLGVREGYNQGQTTEGINTFAYDDPDDQVGSGTLAVTYTIDTGDVAFTRGGETYRWYLEGDIIYNDDLGCATTEDINNGQCNNEYSVEAVTTHEIGHQLGMGHSCEQNDECPDLDHRYAVMYWSTGPCDNYQGQLKDDDIEGINALYGPFCEFEATEDSERFGGAPLEICFELTCSEEYTSIEWDFGDGNTSNEESPCHTYEDKGQFTINLAIEGEEEECGTWEYTEREQAFVLVCGQPEPSEGFGGLFTYEGVSGLTYQMINQTDTSVYGCIDQIAWHVFDGDELVQEIQAWSPKIEFPAEGDYRVVLNVGGPGGVAAAELNIEVTEVSEGCVTAPVGAGFASLFIGLGAAVRRRRSV